MAQLRRFLEFLRQFLSNFPPESIDGFLATNPQFEPRLRYALDWYEQATKDLHISEGLSTNVSELLSVLERGRDKFRRFLCGALMEPSGQFDRIKVSPPRLMRIGGELRLVMRILWVLKRRPHVVRLSTDGGT